MGVMVRALGMLVITLAPIAAAAQPRAADPPTVQIPTLSDADINAWSDKLDRYATVHTRTIRAWGNILRYAAALGLREWRTGRRDSPALLDLDADGFAAAARLARDLAGQAPAMAEVDRAAVPFAAAIESLPGVFNEAAHYYSRTGDYEADKFARGQLMHPRIVAAVEPYLATHRPFLFQVNQARWSLDRQELAMLERRGATGLTWHMRRLMRAAFDASVHLPTYGRADSQIDLAAFDKAISTYADRVNALRSSPVGRPAEGRMADGRRCPSPDLQAPERYLVTLRDLREAYVIRQRVPLMWELRVRDSQLDYHDFWARTLEAIHYDRACGTGSGGASGGQAAPTGRQ